MTLEIAFILLILALVLIAFVWEVVVPEIIAFIVLTTLMVFGILTPTEGLSGFSNPATIIILLLFFVSRALEDVGLIRSIGDMLLNLTNQSLAIKGSETFSW